MHKLQTIINVNKRSCGTLVTRNKIGESKKRFWATAALSVCWMRVGPCKWRILRIGAQTCHNIVKPREAAAIQMTVPNPNLNASSIADCGRPSWKQTKNSRVESISLRLKRKRDELQHTQKTVLQTNRRYLNVYNEEIELY